ncbi:MAG TPA: dihydrodipicolinate reductase C-terminal domain-containing protein [Terriglobales bacterium]|nr:dihydrodipicolinate reductase C-terminal domain-containing protein [Terriglobales bacterium]
MMRQLAIVGTGKMGRLIEQLAPHYGFEVRAKCDSKSNAECCGLTREALAGVDVAVEFTNAGAAPENLKRLAQAGVSVVTGSTGWFMRLDEVREAVEKCQTGLVWSPNFSVGLNLFRQVVAEAARRFAAQEDYGAWGWEIHHAAKKDAPSGTLLALAEEMKRNGFERPVSLSSNRTGTVPGTHEIGFDSAADTITIRHTARSREGFARGALRAARWITGKQGVFEFREILGELP